MTTSNRLLRSLFFCSCKIFSKNTDKDKSKDTTQSWELFSSCHKKAPTLEKALSYQPTDETTKKALLANIRWYVNTLNTQEDPLTCRLESLYTKLESNIENFTIVFKQYVADSLTKMASLPTL